MKDGVGRYGLGEDGGVKDREWYALGGGGRFRLRRGCSLLASRSRPLLPSLRKEPAGPRKDSHTAAAEPR